MELGLTTSNDDARDGAEATSIFDGFGDDVGQPYVSLDESGSEPVHKQKWFVGIAAFVAVAVVVALVMVLVSHNNRQREATWDAAAASMAVSLGVASGTSSYATTVLTASASTDVDAALVTRLQDALVAVDTQVSAILSRNGAVFSEPTEQTSSSAATAINATSSDFWLDVPEPGTYQLAPGSVYQVGASYVVTEPDARVMQDSSVVAQLESDRASLEDAVTQLADSAAALLDGMSVAELNAAVQDLNDAKSALQRAIDSGEQVYTDSRGAVADESVRQTLRSALDSAAALVGAATTENVADVQAASSSIRDAIAPLQSASSAVTTAVDQKKAADAATRAEREAAERAAQEAAEAEASREAEEQAAQEQENSGTDPSDEDGDHDNG